MCRLCRTIGSLRDRISGPYRARTAALSWVDAQDLLAGAQRTTPNPSRPFESADIDQLSADRVGDQGGWLGYRELRTLCPCSDPPWISPVRSLAKLSRYRTIWVPRTPSAKR